MNPLISIILPVYNGERFLKQSINSCQNQTYKNLEIIIVNDCSKDSSLQIALDLQQIDSRIQIINNTTNLKLPASLNAGHKLAKGEFVTWTSDDNVYESNAIEVLYDGIKKTQAYLVFSHCSVIDEYGRITGFLNAQTPNSMLFRNNIGASFLYTKSIYHDLGGYNEELLYVEDYDFWLRIAKVAKIQVIPETLYQYRHHNSSLTSLINEKQSIKEVFLSNKKRVFMELAPLGIINLALITSYFSKDENEIIILERILSEREFLTDLKTYASSFKALQQYEVVKITIQWMVDLMLKNKHLQTWDNLKYLYQESNSCITSIPLKRQVALIIKCL